MENSFRILMVGVEPEVQARIKRVAERAEFRTYDSAEIFMNELDALTADKIDLACCGPNLPELVPIELGQSISSQVAGVPVFFISSEQYSADSRLLIKNGFRQAFFLPLDAPALDREIRKRQAERLGSDAQAFVSFPIEELKVGSILQFDVMLFLPLNRKYVRVFKKGALVEEKNLERLQKGARVIFVGESDEAQFHEYAASLRPKDSTPGVMDHKQKLHGAMRGLFHTLLAPDHGTFEQGKVLLEKAGGVVGDLVGNKAIGGVLDGLFKQMGQAAGDQYEQSLRISVYASLFSMACNRAKPEDLAVAGLFHHVGLVRCPEHLLQIPWEEMTPEERKIYARHPEESVKMMQEKKLIMVPEVHSAILQHHERPDGKGFPRAIGEAKISDAALLLSLASQFDELTALQVGKACLSARAALAHLSHTGTCSLSLIQALDSSFAVGEKRVG